MLIKDGSRRDLKGIFREGFSLLQSIFSLGRSLQLIEDISRPINYINHMLDELEGFNQTLTIYLRGYLKCSNFIATYVFEGIQYIYIYLYLYMYIHIYLCIYVDLYLYIPITMSYFCHGYLQEYPNIDTCIFKSIYQFLPLQPRLSSRVFCSLSHAFFTF